MIAKKYAMVEAQSTNCFFWECQWWKCKKKQFAHVWTRINESDLSKLKTDPIEPFTEPEIVWEKWILNFEFSELAVHKTSLCHFLILQKHTFYDTLNFLFYCLFCYCWLSLSRILSTIKWYSSLFTLFASLSSSCKAATVLSVASAKPGFAESRWLEDSGKCSGISGLPIGWGLSILDFFGPSNVAVS